MCCAYLSCLINLFSIITDNCAAFKNHMKDIGLQAPTLPFVIVGIWGIALLSPAYFVALELVICTELHFCQLVLPLFCWQFGLTSLSPAHFVTLEPVFFIRKLALSKCPRFYLHFASSRGWRLPSVLIFTCIFRHFKAGSFRTSSYLPPFLKLCLSTLTWYI